MLRTTSNGTQAITGRLGVWAMEVAVKSIGKRANSAQRIALG